MKVTDLLYFLFCFLSSFFYLSITCLWQSGHQILAYIKREHHQEAEALKAKEDLQAEIGHLKVEKAIEAKRLAWEKAAEVRSLYDVLQKEEFITT